MADVTGPISTMPGYRGHKVPDGTMCDNHPDRLATVRVQGETDSMGSEMLDFCAECAEKEREGARAEREREKNEERFCDWCKTMQKNTRLRRDFEEGLSGPLYRVCSPCDDKDNARWDEYNREWENRYG